MAPPGAKTMCDLPPDIFGHIINILDGLDPYHESESAPTLRLVCKSWRVGASLGLKHLRPIKTFSDQQLFTLCKSFSNLISVDLTACKTLSCTGLIALSSLPCLEDLNLGECTSAPSAGDTPSLCMTLSRLPLLKRLSYIDSNVSDLSFGDLSLLSSLTTLILDSLANLSGSALNGVGSLTGLEYLSLSHMPAAPEILHIVAKPSLLEFLVLQFSLVDADISSTLVATISCGMPLLEQVDLSGCVLGEVFFQWYLSNHANIGASFELDDAECASCVTLETVLGLVGANESSFKVVGLKHVGTENFPARAVFEAGGVQTVLALYGVSDNFSLVEVVPSALEALARMAKASSACLEAILAQGDTVGYLCGILKGELPEHGLPQWGMDWDPRCSSALGLVVALVEDSEDCRVSFRNEGAVGMLGRIIENDPYGEDCVEQAARAMQFLMLDILG